MRNPAGPTERHRRIGTIETDKYAPHRHWSLLRGLLLPTTHLRGSVCGRLAEFPFQSHLEEVDENAVLAGHRPRPDCGVQVLSWPYVGLAILRTWVWVGRDRVPTPSHDDRLALAWRHRGQR